MIRLLSPIFAVDLQ